MTTIEEEKKVGPKGQLAIPSFMRKSLKIFPGSKVIVKLEGARLYVEKPPTDAVAVFRSIAKKGKSVTSISPHMYEQEFELRH